MSPKKIHGAVAALSALALLTACTPAGSDPDATRDGAKTAEAEASAAAEPVFRIGSVSEAEAAQATAQGSSAKASNSTASATPTSTQTSAPQQAGEVVESGAETTAAPGERISLSVENAALSDISITESDHPRIKTDPGVFFDTAGSELEAADSTEDAKAGSSTPSESASEDSDAITAPDDAAAWMSAYDLVADSTYELSATATSADGEEVDFRSTVTVSAGDASPMAVRTILSDDQTVGVGAPIILTFGSTVAKKYRDDVEHRLSVKVTDNDGKKRKVEGSWAWLPDDPQSRLHFRPKEFWPAHSKVSVDVPLKNVPTTDDTVGQNDLTLDFDIGRKQVVKADAKTHRMVVTRDGKEVMNFPASLGAAKSPSYNGTHVVMSKASDYTMTSEQWDYETDVRWAVRIHNNGEFIHAAPWSTGVQGSANVSHGCINLSTARAKQYYDSAIFGDPVEITGSNATLSTAASDISDWVYEWDEWQKMSALPTS
ncbi:L,D-transpeptidase [Brevibacterium aurantiacum]|uniref:L,D-transpeptidase n=1 Tax=Brevibacterium aurantiacum TaxID=273384 RepID=UPI000050FD05|nr:Ig-like domain-containing protein [Brevibacterium aurantiacum]